MTLLTCDSGPESAVRMVNPVTVRAEELKIPRPPASVVVCCYTELRWEDMRAALDSVRPQLRLDDELILVVDHNDQLRARAQSEFPGVAVVANTYAQGLSGARNTGVETSAGDIVVFLDDDARAEPDWLDRLLIPYADPLVMGVGGIAEPEWPSTRPSWFPPEFDWVVGCSYVGLPTIQEPVRNPIGAAMSFRRTAFDAAGLFTSGIGRIGVKPMGCEETEFGIRLRRVNPAAVILHQPAAVVHHRVTAERATWQYFRRRCYAEGRSKALVAARVGQESALAAERLYARRVLPSGFRRAVATPGDRARAGAIVAGLAMTTAGYLRGRLVRRWAL